MFAASLIRSVGNPRHRRESVTRGGEKQVVENPTLKTDVLRVTKKRNFFQTRHFLRLAWGSLLSRMTFLSPGKKQKSRREKRGKRAFLLFRVPRCCSFLRKAGEKGEVAEGASCISRAMRRKQSGWPGRAPAVALAERKVQIAVWPLHVISTWRAETSATRASIACCSMQQQIQLEKRAAAGSAAHKKGAATTISR